MPLVVKTGNIFDEIADALVFSTGVCPPKRYEEGDSYCLEAVIYNRAGIEELLQEREKIGEIMPGRAKTTEAFALSDKYHMLIHTTIPLGNTESAYQKLENCYYNALKEAKKYKCKKVVFPLLATGHFDYPREDALSIATTMIEIFLERESSLMEVVLYVDEEYIEYTLERISVESNISDDNIIEVSESERKKMSEEVQDYYDYLEKIRKRRQEASLEEFINLKDEDNFDFYEFINPQRDKMRALGKTQSNKQLADMLGCSDKTIDRFFNGEYKIGKTHPDRYIVLGLGLFLEFDYYLINRSLMQLDYSALTEASTDERDLMILYYYKNRMYQYEHIRDLFDRIRSEKSPKNRSDI